MGGVSEKKLHTSLVGLLAFIERLQVSKFNKYTILHSRSETFFQRDHLSFEKMYLVRVDRYVYRMGHDNHSLTNF